LSEWRQCRPNTQRVEWRRGICESLLSKIPTRQASAACSTKALFRSSNAIVEPEQRLNKGHIATQA
jgi:hypothetical protein